MTACLLVHLYPEPFCLSIPRLRTFTLCCFGHMNQWLWLSGKSGMISLTQLRPILKLKAGKGRGRGLPLSQSAVWGESDYPHENLGAWEMMTARPTTNSFRCAQTGFGHTNNSGEGRERILPNAYSVLGSVLGILPTWLHLSFAIAQWGGIVTFSFYIWRHWSSERLKTRWSHLCSFL